MKEYLMTREQKLKRLEELSKLPVFKATWQEKLDIEHSLGMGGVHAHEKLKTIGAIFGIALFLIAIVFVLPNIHITWG